MESCEYTSNDVSNMLLFCTKGCDMTMFIHLNSDGTIAKVLHDRVIRRSNVNKIYVFAPFAPGSTVLIHFQKPNGELITGPMIFKEFNLANQINTWEYSLMNRTITDIAGKVLISLEIRAITEGGVEITATPNTHMWVEESIGELPEIEEVDEFLNLANLAMERVIALEEELEETQLTEEEKTKLNNLPLNTIAELNNKVDKVPGKGLSTNDYTDAEKAKLAGIEAGAEVNKVDSVNGKIGVVVLDQDDIGDGASYKRVSQAEKDIWNNKQDKLVAGDNITIDPSTNVISSRYDEPDGVTILLNEEGKLKVSENLEIDGGDL